MAERDVFHRRSVWVCLGVMIMVLATAGVILAIHLTVDTDETDLPKPTNVLFIVVDDLRPALESYGDKIVIAPNIKQLAAKSIKFNRAYCQQAMCAPSRNSFLTSRRPDTLHLYDTHSYWRRDVGNFTTLPQHFKDHGFHTVSIGKIFHRGEASGKHDDYPYSWSDEPYQPSTLAFKNSPVCPTKNGSRAANLYCPVDVNEQQERTLPDLQSTDEAVKFLKDYSVSANWRKGKPFFLGVGYYKPHIPFKFPKEYKDLYPTMSLAPNRFKPAKMPDVAWNPWTDVRERDDVKELNVSFPFGPLPDDYQVLARTGYYASISYIDDLIGKLLATLQETGFAQNTMIVFTGDHGWSLGEHQEWAKYSNFDDVVRVPLLISIPRVTDKDTKPYCHVQLLGNKLEVNQTMCINSTAEMVTRLETYELVELVDLFPTLADIMHLPVPPLCPLDSASSLFCTEGISLKPLIQHVISAQTFIEDFSGKTAAFSQYPRPSEFPQSNSDLPLLKDIKIMGYSMKTSQYRYTEWIQFSPDTFQGNWSAIYARELYDHLKDEKEDNNEADNPQYESVVKELSKKLQEGWRSSIPR